MGWGRYFLLGDLGQQLDLQDRQREVDQLRDNLRSQGDIDNRQNDWIRFLERENEELKLYVTSLVRLLISKNVLTPQEVEQLVNAVEGSGKPPRT